MANPNNTKKIRFVGRSFYGKPEGNIAIDSIRIIKNTGNVSRRFLQEERKCSYKIDFEMKFNYWFSSPSEVRIKLTLKDQNGIELYMLNGRGIPVYDDDTAETSFVYSNRDRDENGDLKKIFLPDKIGVNVKVIRVDRSYWFSELDSEELIIEFNKSVELNSLFRKTTKILEDNGDANVKMIFTCREDCSEPIIESPCACACPDDPGGVIRLGAFSFNPVKGEEPDILLELKYNPSGDYYIIQNCKNKDSEVYDWLKSNRSSCEFADYIDRNTILYKIEDQKSSEIISKIENCTNIITDGVL